MERFCCSSKKKSCFGFSRVTLSSVDYGGLQAATL